MPEASHSAGPVICAQAPLELRSSCVTTLLPGWRYMQEVLDDGNRKYMTTSVASYLGPLTLHSLLFQ